VKFLVHADDDSIPLGILFARAFNAHVVVIESDETRGHGAAAVEQFRAAGIEAQLLSSEHNWARAVRFASRDNQYDLIIVGRMWRRGLRGILLGPMVPRNLLSDVHTNLLAVRRRRAALRRILIAVGTGPQGSRVLSWGGLIAKAFDAQPLLIHITERAPTMFTGLAGVDENLTRFMNSNTLEAQAFKRAAQTLRVIGIEPELKLARGYVVDEMLAEARSGAYDLIVLGSSYTAAASTRFLMEGVTERIVQRAPCPVLVVREEQTRVADTVPTPN
jgi:nucleotide-binding universal stress UspA family protein